MTCKVVLEYETRGPAMFAIVTIDRSSRANSLVPDLVDALQNALNELDRDAVQGLVLRSEGSFFSSGGDVSAFARLSGAELLDYADCVVGGLQRAVLTLYAMPVPVITRLQGGVTGGSIGLVLSADLVAMDRKAFMQPYYSDMGFGPDGGWTALLRERIAPAKAYSIQALNRRISAEEALELGLADRLAARDELDGVVSEWLDTLSEKSRGTLTATKRLIRSDAAVARMGASLDAERREFLELIAQPDTARRMEAFLK